MVNRHVGTRLYHQSNIESIVKDITIPIANNEEEDDRMVYYAAVIQKLRKELGLARANLSHLDIDEAIQNEQSNTHLLFPYPHIAFCGLGGLTELAF